MNKGLNTFVRIPVRSPFLSEASKRKFMRAMVESGEASAAAPLGPLLGQFQVPMLDFCNSFNDETDLTYSEGSNLRVCLYKFQFSYFYDIKWPKFTFLVHQLLLENSFDLDEFIFEFYFLTIPDLWFLVSNHSSIYDTPYFRSSSIIFGYLTSSKVKIKILGIIVFVKDKIMRRFKFFFYSRFLDEYFYLVGSASLNKNLSWFFSKFFNFSIKSSLEINRLFEFSNKFIKFNRFRFSDTNYSVIVKDIELDKNFLGYLTLFYILDFGALFPPSDFVSNFFFGDYQKIDELDASIYVGINQIIPYFLVYSKNLLVTSKDFSSVMRYYLNNYLSKNIFFFSLIFFFRRLYSCFFKTFVVLYTFLKNYFCVNYRNLKLKCLLFIRLRVKIRVVLDFLKRNSLSLRLCSAALSCVGFVLEFIQLNLKNQIRLIVK